MEKVFSISTKPLNKKFSKIAGIIFNKYTDRKRFSMDGVEVDRLDKDLVELTDQETGDQATIALTEDDMAVPVVEEIQDDEDVTDEKVESKHCSEEPEMLRDNPAPEVRATTPAKAIEELSAEVAEKSKDLKPEEKLYSEAESLEDKITDAAKLVEDAMSEFADIHKDADEGEKDMAKEAMDAADKSAEKLDEAHKAAKKMSRKIRTGRFTASAAEGLEDILTEAKEELSKASEEASNIHKAAKESKDESMEDKAKLAEDKLEKAIDEVEKIHADAKKMSRKASRVFCDTLTKEAVEESLDIETSDEAGERMNKTYSRKGANVFDFSILSKL